MSIKESSDEFNPPVVTTGESLARAARRRSPSDYLALAVATCGVGYMPLAPGTWGSMVGVALYLLVREGSLRFFGSPFGGRDGFGMIAESLFKTMMLVLIVVVTLAGVWAATRVEKLLGRKDPGVVVVDEVAGQLIAFLFVPLSKTLHWWAIAAAFLLFRLFDIWKPYPARRLEALEFGLGIMADDLIAGVYAAICMALLVTLSLSL
jgi:phosphatidylglycerophosphatase A